MSAFRRTIVTRTVATLVAALVLCSATVRAQIPNAVPVELSTIGIDGRTGTPIVVLRDPELAVCCRCGSAQWRRRPSRLRFMASSCRVR